MNEPNHTPARRPRVLIVSALVGAGHKQAARAIAAGLAERGAEIDVEHVDALDFVPRWYRFVYADGFALMMTRLGWLYGLGFRLANRPTGPRRKLSERIRLRLERSRLRKFARYLRENPPDLVVHTHFLTPPIVTHLRRRGRLDTPQFVVITDNLVHRWWYCERVEQYFAPAEFSTGPLREWGVEPDRITVSGIPILPKWSQELDRERIRREWELPPDRPVVLLSGGTEFTCGPVVKIARRIAAERPDAFVLVLAGRNKRLLGKLARLSEAGERVVGVGFTDRIHELVEVASLFVTKAGGITTAECLSRHTPMVLMKPVPGQEAGNARYFEREGVAVIARGPRDIAREAARLLDDEPARREMARRAQALHRPGRQTICEAILRQLGAGG
jgi:processive 1,2-diacylglycerol beta-glucosyltransferase